MTLIAESLAALGSAYLLAGAQLAVFQRRLQYSPNTRFTELKTIGLSGGEELRLSTNDGETLVAWHFPPRGAQPLIIYFHGNGGAWLTTFRASKGFSIEVMVFSLPYIAAKAAPLDRLHNVACCWMAKPPISKLLVRSGCGLETLPHVSGEMVDAR
jgi:hypothetical protein